MALYAADGSIQVATNTAVDTTDYDNGKGIYSRSGALRINTTDPGPGLFAADGAYRGVLDGAGSGLYAADGAYRLTTSGVKDGSMRVTLVSEEGGGGGLLFEDDFSSGDISKTENNFVWTAGNGNVTVISGFSKDGATGNCLRFAWGTGAQQAEQRFNFSGDEYPELWLSWYQYFPDGTESPTRGPVVERTEGGNNKLLRMFGWNGGPAEEPIVAEQAPRMGAETFTTSPAGDELSNLEAALIDANSSIGGIEGTDYLTFLSDANRGRWFQIEYHVKANTSHGTPNGEMHMWVDDVLVSSFEDLDSQLAAEVGFGGGYLWGSQNGGYVNANTLTYVSHFKISNTGRTGP